MTVRQNRIFHRYLTRRLYSRDTPKHSCLNLSWLFTFQSCARHMHHFAGCLVASYPRKLFSLQLLESSHTLSLSLTQPLQLNPTINTGYNKLNKITIKFGTELKPTKHIVVNYNFTNHSKQIVWDEFGRSGFSLLADI